MAFPFYFSRIVSSKWNKHFYSDNLFSIRVSTYRGSDKEFLQGCNIVFHLWSLMKNEKFIKMHREASLRGEKAHYYLTNQNLTVELT